MRRKRIVLVVLLLAVVGYFGYNYLYQDHRDISSEKAEAELTSEELSNTFRENPSNNLLNSTVSVKGVISETEPNSITIDDKVNCSFNELPDTFSLGDSIYLKGRVIGYDDLFEIVKMDQCSLLK